ncbi:hypothetical protein EWE75_09490 [Sphingomonas populi]|uniref:Glycosyl hydrolase family 43 n=1 Tax=Sphingomonas populi TaxID=2484750 RepID=A0A4Q6XVE8_9SPHN|nr:glycoside hydrolase family protein [Sphingomonas populi]RZF64623.1 hypothetical protein EWE75_09490 [Sphingomonas populi]
MTRIQRLRLAFFVLASMIPPVAHAQETAVPAEQARDLPVLGPKAFISYFKPIPIQGKLSTTAWGADQVGPRDPANGLEDPAMTRWNYWDGKVLKGPDGKYRMFASRWDQALGHKAWGGSKAILAVSESRLGPYHDRGLIWPDDQAGLGHNVTALRLPDGRYAVVISETRDGTVFVSRAIDGPFKKLGTIAIDQSHYPLLKTPGDRVDNPGTPAQRLSNASVILRPDGAFQIVPRSGQVLISRTGILGPYTVMGDSIYFGLAGIPQRDMGAYEDPVIWYSGGWYHVIVNHWRERRAYHLLSRDGITGWRFQGLAYEQGSDFVRYAGGTTNHWNKLERPSVLIEGTHVTAMTFAVTDTLKDSQTGSNGHGSKVIVVPFDGAAMDRDLATVDVQEHRD